MIPYLTYSQQYADKEYYLIDSLIINDLNEYDRILIDSCLSIYHKETIDTIKIAAISHIAENCMDGHIWPKYNVWVNNYTKDRTDTPYFYKEYTSSLSNIGYVYKNKGQVTKALECYNKALNLQLNIDDNEGIANTFNNIGIIYDNLGLIKKALNHFHDALEIYEAIDDKDGIAISLNNIGSIYERQGHITKALEYYYNTFEIYDILGAKEGVANAYNNIGANYNYQGENKNALKYYHKALSIQTDIGDMEGMSTSLNNIGIIYKKQGVIPKALEYYHKALQISTDIGDQEGTAHSLNNIGIIYTNQGNLEKGLEYLTKGFKLSNEIGYPYYITTSSNGLSQIAVKQNNYKTAYEMYKIHITMRDSINNLETQRKTIQQETKYDYELKKTVDDARNDRILAIKDQQKIKQNLITNGILAGLVLVALFLVFVFNRLRITKRQKLEIETQKLIVEKAHQETEQQKEIIEVAHKEITDSINYALRLQRAILPSFTTINSYLDNFIVFQPKDVVSGDFYWFENKKIDGKDISMIASADCTGHGVPGAMVSVVCSSALNRAVNEFGLTEPSKILDKTREIVIKTFSKSGANVKDGMDIALCIFIDNKVIFSGANNPLWIVRDTVLITPEQLDNKTTLVNPEKTLIEIKGDKQPIGIDEQMKPFTQSEIELYEGDLIYFFTDGFADQFGGNKGKKFKYRPFKQLLLDISNKSMSAQKELIEQNFNNWKGELDQIDDVCIIGVKRNLKS
jgi:tetratricopeptide (TPR) repeat protein